MCLISAKTGYNVFSILDHILIISQERKKIIPQEELDRFVKEVRQIHKEIIYTKSRQKTKLRITRMRQLKSSSPLFLLEKNTKEPLPQGFQGFFENRFRERFGFLGTPIEFRVKTQEHENTRT
jgi:GTP-binding protein